MKFKITVDGKVYEVEVEVAPEPPQVYADLLVQRAAARVPGGSPGRGGACTDGGDGSVERREGVPQPGFGNRGEV